MNILLKTLYLNRRHLARTLYLQLDNCFRENKNRHVLCFAALLVEYNVIEEVFINFLVVGHTHEDIDQMFSTFASKIRQRNLYTLADLYSSLKSSYTPEVHVEDVTQLYDFKQWLDPHMYARMKNHSHPHCFRFKKLHGHVRMHYRLWSSDEWKPKLQYREGSEDPEPESVGLICFKSIPDLRKSPDWVVPSLDKMDIPQLKRDLPHGYEGRFMDGATEWWTSFLKDIDKLEEVPEQEQSWMLEKLVEYVNSKPSTSSDNASSLPSRLQDLNNKLSKDCPPVCIGNQGLPEQPAPVTLMDDYQSMEEGMLVATYVEYLPHRPQIAKVLEKDEDGLTMNVHWYSSSWSGPCKPRYSGSASSRRPYFELLDIRTAILWDFSLTGKKGCLKAHTVKLLKEKYEELEQK